MQSFIVVLRTQPKALWAYLGLSMLILAYSLAEVGSATFHFNAWADGVWVALVVAVAAGVALARYLLCAFSALAFFQIALIASHRYGVGEILISLALVAQMILLCSPSFQDREAT